MKTIRNIVLGAFILLSVVACEYEIKFKGEDSDPMLVMNALVEVGEKIQVSLTESQFFLEDDKPFKRINDGEVMLYVNGEFEETLIFKEAIYGNDDIYEIEYNDFNEYGFYESSYIPKAGDKIRLSANSGTLTPVYSEIIVPQKLSKVEIEIIDIEEIRIPTLQFSDYEYDGKIDIYEGVIDTVAYMLWDKIKLKLNFKDDQSIKNYYRIELRQRMINIYDYAIITEIPFSSNKQMEDLYWYFGSMYSSNDAVFAQNLGSLNGLFDDDIESNLFVLFTDEIFDGQEYGLELTVMLKKNRVDLNGDPVDIEDIEFVRNELEINLQHLSSEYYLYLRSLEAHNTHMPIFSEPVQIYSNIKGGVGIVGSITPNRVKISIP